jgi:RNA polymerase sigma-70 factor (sigma-E family)
MTVSPGREHHRSAPDFLRNQSRVSDVGVDVEHIVDHQAKVDESGTDAFVLFYQAEYPGMVRLAHALTGSAESAEDVVQDAFARLHDRVGGLENPGGYLRTTVVNLCRDRERHGRRERDLNSQTPDVPALSLGASELVDVLLSLPYRQRAVLVLRYWGDWSEAEIARSLGCRPGTVKALVSRGLARLRKDVAP